MDDGAIFGAAAIGIAATVAAFVQKLWGRPSGRTGSFVAPVWAAAEVLAKSRGHSELREEHLFAALLFTSEVKSTLISKKVNVDDVGASLDAHLATLATYRMSEASEVTIAPALAKRVRDARDDVLALFDVLLDKPTPAIIDAMAKGRAKKFDPPEENGRGDVVHLRIESVKDRLALAATVERHFGLSRAAATFVVETAVRDGHALVGVYPSQEALPMIDAAKSELESGASLSVSSDKTPPPTRANKVSVSVKIDQLVELVLTLAATIAQERTHAEVTTSHLLQVLLRRKAIAAAMTEAGANVAAIEKELSKNLQNVPTSATESTPPASEAVQRVIRSAVVQAQSADSILDEACVLVALFDDGDEDTARAFAGGGLHHEELLALVQRLPKRSVPKKGEKEIVLYNDDITTMDEVISLLKEVFALDDYSARELTFEVHFIGESIVATHVAAEADALVSRANEWCAKKRVPLRVRAR